MEQIDIIELKDKFSDYLNKLYTNNKLSVDSISNTIIENNLFDFLEENKTREFLSCSYEEFVYKLYKINSIYVNNSQISELIWASKMYLTLSLNLNIPLKTIVLLCPLKQMLELFEVNHETNDIQTIDYFKTNVLNKSILKALRKLRNVTVRQLSIMTGININTLNAYEKNNTNLYNASFSNIQLMIQALNVSCSFFKKESSFIPFNYLLLENKQIQAYMLNFFNDYYKKELSIKSMEPIIELNDKNKTIYVDEKLLSIAYKQAINLYLKDEVGLLF